MFVREATLEDTYYLPIVDQSATQLFKTIPKLAWLARAEVMPTEKHQMFIQLGKVWLVETENKQIAGFIVTKAHGKLLHIYQLSVDCHHQRQGVGKSLIATAYQYAVQNNFAAVTLTTFLNVPWNAPFYSTQGFYVLNKDQQEEWLVDILEAERGSELAICQRCAMSRPVLTDY